MLVKLALIVSYFYVCNRTNSFMKETAEAYLGHDIKDAEVTVPAYVDNMKVDYFINELKRALRHLHTAHDRATTTLFALALANIEIDSLFEDFYASVTRANFEKLCSDLFKSTLEPMRDAKLGKSSVNNIVLAGGSTGIPKIQKFLLDFFNVDIFVKVPIIFKGIPGGDNCTDDPGVEAIRRFITGKARHTLAVDRG